MTGLERAEPGALVLRDATSVVPPPPWAARLAKSRMIVASGMHALTTGPLLPASALAVAAWAAAKAAARAAGRGESPRGRAMPGSVGRVPGPVAPGARLEVSWTHVEVRWRG